MERGGAAGASDFDGVGGDDAGSAGDVLDLVSLEEQADAAGEGFDNLILAGGMRAGKVDGEIAPCGCRGARRCVWLGSRRSVESSNALEGMQPMCRQVPPGRRSFSTPAVLQPELCLANAGDVPARAGADDDEVVGHETTRSISGRLERRVERPN